jgi:Family of unknown function (DUF5681)
MNPNLEKGAPHRFKPGASGNPGGRPKKRPISERYEELAELELPEKERICRTVTPFVRFSAFIRTYPSDLRCSR